MPTLKDIDGVIFDLGNTLIPFTPRDSMEFVMKWYSSSKMGSFDIPFSLFLETYREVVREERSRAARERWETSVDERSRRVAEKLSNNKTGIEVPFGSLKEHHSASFAATLHINSSARRVLDILSRSTNEKGTPLKLGLISNAGDPEAVRDFLDRESLTQYFCSIVISGDVGFAKPRAEIFLRALDMMKIKAERSVYVGDRYETDFMGSARVKMKPVYIRQFKTAGEPPEGVEIEPTIKHILDLIPLLMDQQGR
ncbi:MAG: HAD family hydrolase [Thermoplasmatota archaeon]